MSTCPPPGFRARLYSFNHPGKKIKANRGQNQGRASGINTLSSKVYTRGVFHAQKIYTWTHKTAKVGNVTGVVPLQTKTQASTTTCSIDALARPAPGAMKAETERLFQPSWGTNAPFDVSNRCGTRQATFRGLTTT